MRRIPITWPGITSKPESYFDTSKFRLPAPLKTPEMYLSNPVDAYMIATYFSTTEH